MILHATTSNSLKLWLESSLGLGKTRKLGIHSFNNTSATNHSYFFLNNTNHSNQACYEFKNILSGLCDFSRKEEIISKKKKLACICYTVAVIARLSTELCILEQSRTMFSKT